MIVCSVFHVEGLAMNELFSDFSKPRYLIIGTCCHTKIVQGKTLAFVLPILESLTNGPAKASRKTGYGRPPSVLVLLPTRELASQVYQCGLLLHFALFFGASLFLLSF